MKELFCLETYLKLLGSSLTGFYLRKGSQGYGEHKLVEQGYFLLEKERYDANENGRVILQLKVRLILVERESFYLMGI